MRARPALTTSLVLALALAAGCAGDPRYEQGLEWVQWNEQQKARLEAEGFPQYTGGSER
ncbi:MAG: hypothetical protein U1F45_18610 [Burkholderiales bacterium]